MEEAKEAERLAKVKSSMTKEDLAELARATEELRLKQETPDPPEALKAVPSLALSDIPKKSTNIPIDVRPADLILFTVSKYYCIDNISEVNVFMEAMLLLSYFCPFRVFHGLFVFLFRISMGAKSTL